jgi:hypothetical protein
VARSLGGGGGGGGQISGIKHAYTRMGAQISGIKHAYTDGRSFDAQMKRVVHFCI